MTISSSTTKTIYVGNGSTTNFPIAFAYADEAEVKVYLTDLLGATTQLTTNILINTSTNIVTYPVSGSPIATGIKLTVARQTPLVQEVDLTNQGYFNPEVIEGAFDKVTRITQELSEKLSRCVSFPLSETPSATDAETYLLAIENAKALAIEAKEAAEAAQIASEASLDSFDDRYLGAKASDPSVDNDGNTLLVGCIYFNTVLAKMRVWNGITWDYISSNSPSIKYVINNNQTLTNLTGLSFNSTFEKSAVLKFEIERVGSIEYRQILDAHVLFDGTSWMISFGNFTGSDLRQDVLELEQEVTISITSGGQIQYSTGNLTGHTSSSIKVIQFKMEV